jgi:hypothetical protein
MLICVPHICTTRIIPLQFVEHLKRLKILKWAIRRQQWINGQYDAENGLMDKTKPKMN